MLHKPDRNMGLLHPAFAQAAEALLLRVRRADLPLYVYEAHRSRERQRELQAKRVSKTSLSAHQRGCALDFVGLVQDRDGRMRWTWDNTGTDIGLDVWEEFGRLVKKDVRLFWGGDWRRLPTDSFDIYHVELVGWERVK